MSGQIIVRRGVFAAVVGFAFGLNGLAATAATETVIYSFQGDPDGWFPTAGLIEVNGVLYGTTELGGDQNSGTVFSLDPSSGAEKIVYSFCIHNKCTDGANPSARLIDENGTLYGTTSAGGSHNRGTVFSLDPSNRTETVLYSFCSQKKCFDGASPSASLIDVNGTLFGTTGFGGGRESCVPDQLGGGCGTVFSLNLTDDAESVLYTFCSKANCKDGAVPSAGLTVVHGKLYGTTSEGGVLGCLPETFIGCGTVFSLDPDTDREKVVCAFTNQNCPNGWSPGSDLIDVKGYLYGTTQYGGAGECTILRNYVGCGTVFSVNPKTGAGTVVYAFLGGTDGQFPVAGLINAKGNLYGTTPQGGTYGGGTVFSVNPDTGAETVLHSFGSGTDGAGSYSVLINVKGTLYGTTARGGTGNCSYGCGTVFAITP